MRSLDQALVGCAVLDHWTGQVLGRVRGMQPDPTDPARVALTVIPPDPEGELEPLPGPEGEPVPATDYMVGQRASLTLLDPGGGVLVEAGSAITSEILARARACGLLHRLAARF